MKVRLAEAIVWAIIIAIAAAFLFRTIGFDAGYEQGRADTAKHYAKTITALANAATNKANLNTEPCKNRYSASAIFSNTATTSFWETQSGTCLTINDKAKATN